MNAYIYKEILPKCWIARIQKYWVKKIPTDIPESSSSFSLQFTREQADAIEIMEENIGTEESIITPEMIPDHQALGSYLGTFNVDGEAGEKTLLSPIKVNEKDVEAIGMHYTGEAWEKIEDAAIEDGYVWGTVDSFSPIAVFTTRHDGYVDESGSMFTNKVYVCNGVHTKIYKDGNAIIAESAYGTKTTLDNTYTVVGGSYDGLQVDSTNLYIGKDVELYSVIGGSYNWNAEKKTHCKSINVEIEGATITTSVTGAGIWCSADEVNITVRDSEIKSGLGCQTVYYKGHDSNHTLEDSLLRFGAPQWVAKSNIKIYNSDIAVLYPAGNNGFSYTYDATLEVDGGNYDYLAISQSNGTVDNTHCVVKNATIGELNSNTRGVAGILNGKFKNCQFTKVWTFDDKADTSAATLDKVYYDFDAECKLGVIEVGAVAGAPVTTAEEAAKHIGAFKISRNAEFEYAEGAEAVLKNIIVIK